MHYLSVYCIQLSLSKEASKGAKSIITKEQDVKISWSNGEAAPGAVMATRAPYGDAERNMARNVTVDGGNCRTPVRLISLIQTKQNSPLMKNRDLQYGWWVLYDEEPSTVA